MRPSYLAGILALASSPTLAATYSSGDTVRLDQIDDSIYSVRMDVGQFDPALGSLHSAKLTVNYGFDAQGSIYNAFYGISTYATSSLSIAVQEIAGRPVDLGILSISDTTQAVDADYLSHTSARSGPVIFDLFSDQSDDNLLSAEDFYGSDSFDLTYDFLAGTTSGSSFGGAAWLHDVVIDMAVTYSYDAVPAVPLPAGGALLASALGGVWLRLCRKPEAKAA